MEAPRPAPGKDEILLQTKAVSINPIDYKFATFPNWMRRVVGVIPYGQPHVPCRDFSGAVAEVGEGVWEWKVGDEVFGRLSGFDHKGSLQHYTLILSFTPMIRKPLQLTHAEAAATPLVYTTVYNALVNLAQLPLAPTPAPTPTPPPGEGQGRRSVLILGGTTSTGSTAIQLSRQMGASVVTTCSGPSTGLVQSLSADEVLDYQSEDVVQRALTSTYRPFNVILDCVGGTDLISYLRQAGHRRGRQAGGIRVHLTGEATHQLTSVIRAVLAQGLRTLKGSVGGWLSHYMPLRSLVAGPRYHFALEEPSKEALQSFPAFLAAGNKVMVDSTFNFDEAKPAFARIESGRAKGKVVIEI